MQKKNNRTLALMYTVLLRRRHKSGKFLYSMILWDLENISWQSNDWVKCCTQNRMLFGDGNNAAWSTCLYVTSVFCYLPLFLSSASSGLPHAETTASHLAIYLHYVPIYLTCIFRLFADASSKNKNKTEIFRFWKV